MEGQPDHEFFRGLDAKGEAEVRRILARKGWNPRRTALANHWLSELDNSREALLARENLDHARSAKNAAWTAAIAAVIANVIAIAAIVIAYLASRPPA